MKFRKTIPIILSLATLCPYAEETGDVNDIFEELAKRNTTHEDLKKNPEYQKEAILRNTSTPSFLIVGEDSFGFAQTKEFITCAEGIISDYLGLKINPNNKIILKLISSDNEEYDKQFYIEADTTSINLMLRWDENLEYEAFSKFIMGAMLRKLAQEKKLDEGYELPYFLELSMSILLQEKVKGRRSASLAKEASSQELLSLKDSLNITRGVGDNRQKELSAYWNLLALNRFFKDKKQLQSLLKNYLYRTKGFDIYSELSKLYDTGDIDKYFKCMLYYELSMRIGGIMTMQESAEELLRLSFIRKDSKNIALGDKDILKYANDDEVKSSIDRRIAEIKLLLARINPAYFNALLSLGEMFEAAYRNSEEDFTATRLKFIEEFKSAKYIEGRANMLLKSAQESL